MRIKFILPFCCAIAAMVSSCSSSDNGPTAAEKERWKKMEIEDSLRRVKNSIPVNISYEQYGADSLKERTVVFEAYVKTPLLFYTNEKNNNSQIDLIFRKLQTHGLPERISCAIKNGNGENNTMLKLKDKFTEADLVITDNSGQKVGSGDKVRVTGIASYIFKCSKIEKIEDQGFDYAKSGAPEVTPANAKDKSLDKKLVYSEGILEVPMYGFVVANKLNVNLNSKGSKDPVQLRVFVGKNPSQMEDLPANYRLSDIKFHDSKNGIIKQGQKVRVYGVMNGGYIEVENIDPV